LGLSHSRIAYLARRRHLWISKSTVCAIELGETVPRRHHLRALAVALAVPLEQVASFFATARRSASRP